MYNRANNGLNKYLVSEYILKNLLERKQGQLYPRGHWPLL
jgi:hypothetical protein